jgi:cytochrome d ubiquinol oxidase subunit I
MRFNPDTARNEMMNFWDVFLSPVAVNKFLHTIASGFVLASIFVVGVSAWFLLQKREIKMAKKSIAIASVFGIITSIFLIVTGDGSARRIARVQPMKFAAIEGLYDGHSGAPLIAIGLMARGEDTENIKERFHFKMEIPNMLSYMTYLDPNAFIPGVNDMLHGNEEQGILPAREKIERGRYARQVLKDYKEAIDVGDTVAKDSLAAFFDDPTFLDENFRYFGYGFLNDINSLVPNVPLTFYSFHVMVFLGMYFLGFLALALYYSLKDMLERKRWFLRIALFTIPLAYLATILGWVVAEMGRQPWTIQDLLPTVAAVSQVDASAVQLTFALFAIIFTALLIAEVRIMTKQIKIGPKEGGK